MAKHLATPNDMPQRDPRHASNLRLDRPGEARNPGRQAHRGTPDPVVAARAVIAAAIGAAYPNPN